MKKTKTRKAPVRSVKLSKTKRSPAKRPVKSRARAKSKKKSLLVRLGLKTEYEYKKLHIGMALVFIAGLIAGVVIGVNHYTSAAGSGNPFACPTYPALSVGNTGDCVKRVQWYELNKANCSSCAITGTFDANLKTAVTAFQAWNGIPAIGTVNDQTWKTYNVFEGAAADPNALLPGTIDGSRVDAAGKLFTAGGSVTVDAVSKTTNPYSFTNEAHGRHWVSAEAPAGYKVVGYSYCINGANCVGTNNLTAGPVDVPGNGKVTVTWHYTASAGAAATTPVAAPPLNAATKSTPVNSSTAPSTTVPKLSCFNTYPDGCTQAHYNQEVAFLSASTPQCLKSYADGCTAKHSSDEKAFLKAVAPQCFNTYADGCTAAHAAQEKAFLVGVAGNQRGSSHGSGSGTSGSSAASSASASCSQDPVCSQAASLAFGANGLSGNSRGLPENNCVVWEKEETGYKSMNGGFISLGDCSEYYYEVMTMDSSGHKYAYDSHLDWPVGNSVDQHKRGDVAY